jgi:hypothetical protein
MRESALSLAPHAAKVFAEARRTINNPLEHNGNSRLVASLTRSAPKLALSFHHQCRCANNFRPATPIQSAPLDFPFFCCKTQTDAADAAGKRAPGPFIKSRPLAAVNYVVTNNTRTRAGERTNERAKCAANQKAPRDRFNSAARRRLFSGLTGGGGECKFISRLGK